jgi:alpha-galactosidase
MTNNLNKVCKGEWPLVSIRIFLRFLPGVALWLGGLLPATAGEPELVQRLRQAPAQVILADGQKADDAVVNVERQWEGAFCRSKITNNGALPVKVQRVDLFDLKHGLPPDTPFYGESFQMLAQNIGTLEAPKDMGSSYPDRTHYKLTELPGLRTVRGMLLLRPAGEEQILLGFASCRRFDGLLSFDGKRLVVSFDAEGLELAPGESWELEEFSCAAAASREKLLYGLCQRIERNHPRRAAFKAPPLGWCSWYCFGPTVTVADIRKNLDWIAANAPELRYIQIDDGYQPWMGDWLESGKSFGGDIRAVLGEIRQRGFEPGIWLAPFIASPESKLFQGHPGWFVKDEEGKPLRSDKVGFGGWRLGPWYVLDGTHPEAQAFIENTFRTMRQEWGCTYFKLDANYWGALNKGRFHDPKATRIEAYRRGMEAALRGAGDAFILGCNHPIWPSLGLVDGARTSNDITRNWVAIRDMGRQNLLRGWQNGRFWWNDPDCALLGPGMLMDISGKRTGQQGLPWNEVIFHATTVHASGGMMLSGDNLPALAPEPVSLLRKLIPPTGKAASFADETLAIGRTPKEGGEYLYLFNWGDEPVERVVALPAKAKLTNYWTGEELGAFEGQYRVPALAPHSALLLDARFEKSK